MFVTIFWLAKPIMDAIQGGGSKRWAFDGALTAGPLKDLLNDGVFSGVGTVVVFVPQIALLFFFLAILEDSGYLARAAFLMDRLLSKVGLHGKSFIPLLSSFALRDSRHHGDAHHRKPQRRLATILVAPFMSCSARLPVYTLLIGTFFANVGPVGQAGIMLACYVLGIVAAAVTAMVFQAHIPKGPAAIVHPGDADVQARRSVADRRPAGVDEREAFLTKAGTIIFCLSVILWALAYYPRLPESKSASVAAAARVKSLADQIAAERLLPGSQYSAAQWGKRSRVDNSTDALAWWFRGSGRKAAASRGRCRRRRAIRIQLRRSFWSRAP